MVINLGSSWQGNSRSSSRTLFARAFNIVKGRMASRRKEIVEFIVGQLKNIDGQSSTYDASYTYNNNLFENVFRKLKFLDEVNDFPAVYVSAGTELRNFNSKRFDGSVIRRYH